MDAYLDLAYDWTSKLVGPHSVLPWWAWTAGLVMIFWGVLAPGVADWREAERRPGHDRR